LPLPCTCKPSIVVGRGLTSADLAPVATKPVPSKVPTAPGLHPVSTKLAALASAEMTGVVDWTSMATFSVAETSAELVAVNATEYWPI